MAKNDPLERIQGMINDSITKALGDREQREREEKDPWARFEGTIRRAVDAALDERGVRSGGGGTGGGRRRGRDEGGDDAGDDGADEGGNFLEALGLKTGGGANSRSNK